MGNPTLSPQSRRESSAALVELPVLVHLCDGKVSGMLTRLWFDGCEITVAEALAVGVSAEVEIPNLGRIRGRVAKTDGRQLAFYFSSECPV